MALAIEEIRKSIEEKYIGFGPNSNSVKPAHIANGMFRTIAEITTDTKLLKQFSITKAKKLPPNYEIDRVFNELQNEGLIDRSFSNKKELQRFRVLANKVLSADNALYVDGGETYSAANKRFLSKDTIAQDGGEFIAQFLKRRQSLLYQSIESELKSENDTITKLFLPVLNQTEREYLPSHEIENLKLWRLKLNSTTQASIEGIYTAAECLAQHLIAHPNKLFKLRMSVLFSCFILIRHLANLEVYYSPEARGSIMPFLLDFSEGSNSPIVQASAMTYTHISQAIARFYAWAFGEYLNELFTVEELLNESCPKYKKKQVQAEMLEIWESTKLDIENSKGEKNTGKFTRFGRALYDLLALEATSNPVNYLRQLGIRCGLFWPPQNFQPTKQFRLHQDMLEVLIRGAVKPGETIDIDELLNRFWDRYGIIVGGRSIDEQRLLENGIFAADGVALETNQKRFSESLEKLNFARLLADGILQIETEKMHGS